MKKVPCLFKKTYVGQVGSIFNEVTPDCEWVLRGEGKATIKYDGTACLVKEGKLFKRYDAKRGKVPPEGFIPCQEAPDPVTLHWPGWLLVGTEPESKHHLAAFEAQKDALVDGTYELVGKHFQGNPYKLEYDRFIPHGIEEHTYARTMWELQEFLQEFNHEGLVFHHPDGRMAKIRRRDFNFKWPMV